MLLSDLVTASQTVAGTRSRTAKTAALAEALRAADPAEVETVTSYLSGVLRQRRTGLGWRGLTDLPPPAREATLTVGEVHEAFEELSTVAGAGSRQRRADLVAALFGRATADEQAYLRGLATGELRQGALDGLMLEAVAAAAEVPGAAVRRAAMLCGATVPVAVAALTGGAEALGRFRLEVGRPLRPMLASSAPDLSGALDKLDVTGGGREVAVDCKLDGIRLQVHKDGRVVRAYTRTLEEITDRVPEVVELVAALPAQRLVLDGEAIALDADGRPRPFQETAARTASRLGVEELRRDVPLTPYFFDVLHVDGEDLLDAPARERLDRLAGTVPGTALVPRLTTGDPDAAAAFFADVVTAGHEGVVVKDLQAPYEAGRRGASWVKVKPRHTLDLVVLAVEWGSGRRQGWLSNIHLGARNSEAGGITTLGKTLDGTRTPIPDGWVPVGKTFKGMTDETLAWQTERFTELAIEPGATKDSYVVPVHPEQVVEVAFDGIQRSSRYPGGVALRFARVLRYRHDKTADEADTIGSVLGLF